MADQAPFPNIEAVTEESLTGEDGAGGMRNIVELIWYYRPLIFLGISVMMALSAYVMWPEDLQQIDTLDNFYTAGNAALHRATDPNRPLKPAGIRKALQESRVKFYDLFHYYPREIDRRIDLLNPYLLRAESTRLYAAQFPGAKVNLRRALRDYNLAAQWEKRTFGDTPIAIKNQTIFFTNNYPPESDAHNGATPASPTINLKEIQERQRRRKLYIQYYRAVLQSQAVSPQSVRLGFLALLRQLQQDALATDRAMNLGDEAAAADRAILARRRFPPRRFELTEEDGNRLHYHLANIYEKVGEIAAAEQAYRAFLRQAKRSREQFMAMMRLGEIALHRGRSARGEVSVLGREAERQAGVHFNAAAEIFRRVIRASAPEDIMRTAYFQGAVAYLSLAEGMAVGGATWWDNMSAVGKDLRHQLETFSGRRLPERASHLLPALGDLLRATGTALPDPLVLTSQTVLGDSIVKATHERKTLRAIRDEYLARARQFLEGAQGKTGDPLNGSARVMIARTYNAAKRPDRALQLLNNTLRKFPDRAVQIAGRMSKANSFLLKGNTTRALKLYTGGFIQTSTSALTRHDIANLTAFARRLVKAATITPRTPLGRVWDFLSPDEQAAAERVVHSTGRHPERHQLLVNALNSILKRRDFFHAELFADLPLSPAAQALMKRDHALLSQREVEWLNRLILEALFGGEIRGSSRADWIPPLPPGDALPKNYLFTERDIEAGLQAIINDLLSNADAFAAERGKKETSERRKNVLVWQEWRAIEDAILADEFRLTQYHPHPGELLMSSAEHQERIARLAALVRSNAAARDWQATAAQTYMRVFNLIIPNATDADGLRRQESLRRAGHNFFAAQHFGPATEANQTYVLQYGTSDQAGQAQNLLGHALEHLNRLTDAAHAYRENTARRTPDGRKAMFYLGAVLRRIEVLKAGKITRPYLGDPAAPLARINTAGVLTVETALQAFGRIRGLTGIGWASRPWRWATFALGETWFDIAEIERAKNPAKPPLWLGHYRQAKRALKESLERYILKPENVASPNPALGLDANLEPEDYGEVVCARFRAEYLLAQVETTLAQNGQPKSTFTARALLQNLINTQRYPEVMFTPSTEPLYHAIAQHARRRNRAAEKVPLPVEPLLGYEEGPRVSAATLAQFRRNAFSMLGRNFFAEGVRLRRTADAPPTLAQQNFQNALAVYREAHDRLPPRDHPEIIFYQAECMLQLNRAAEARKLFLLAMNKAASQSKSAAAQDAPLKPDFWRKKAANRLADMKDGYAP